MFSFMWHMGRETREMLFRPMSEWRKASLRSSCVSQFFHRMESPNLSSHRLTHLLAFIRLFGNKGRLQHFILLIVNKFNGGKKANCVCPWLPRMRLNGQPNQLIFITAGYRFIGLRPKNSRRRNRTKVRARTFEAAEKRKHNGFQNIP